MTSDQIGGIVRALASAIGGYLVGKGLLDASTATSLGGAAVTIATAIWSFWTNKPAAAK
jgi:hypothetical protein